MIPVLGSSWLIKQTTQNDAVISFEVDAVVIPTVL